MEENHYFTAREIDALIPRLEQIFAHIQTCKSRAEELAAQMMRTRDGTLPSEEAQWQMLRSQVEFLMQAVEDDVQHIQRLGGVIKDIEIGLVDFLGDVNGQDVWLCWKRGEKHIGFWHTLDSGYSQRRALNPARTTHH